MKRLLVPLLALSVVTAGCGKSLQQQCVDKYIEENEGYRLGGDGLEWVSEALLPEAVRYCSGGS